MPKSIREKLKWLDPFTYVDAFLLPRINPKNNAAISWTVYIITAFIFAWVIYTLVGIALGTPSPMVIVLSQSMAPLYNRGDVIVMGAVNAEQINVPAVDTGYATLAATPLSDLAVVEGSTITFHSGEKVQMTKQGSVVVYFSGLLKKPIIHRAVVKLKAADGWYVLTKGDSVQNTTIDQDCSNGNCIALYPVPVSELQGRALFHVPFIGCLKLWIIDDLLSLLSRGKLSEDFTGYC